MLFSGPPIICLDVIISLRYIMLVRLELDLYACVSALYRTAARNVTIWASWVNQMTTVTKEHLLAPRETKGLDYAEF